MASQGDDKVFVRRWAAMPNEDETGLAYAHFDEATQEYHWGPKLGACVFTRACAESFIAAIEDPDIRVHAVVETLRDGDMIIPRQRLREELRRRR